MLTKSDIDWLKSEFLPALTDSVKNSLSAKLDEINTKLDKFVGDVETKRREQELHAEKHSEIDDKIESLEKKLPKSH